MRQLLRDARERLEIVESALAALGVARAKPRRDELLDEARLAARGGEEGAQMACVDPEAGEPRAGGGDVGLRLPVEMLACLDARLQHAVLLELADELARHGRPVAELGEIDLVLRSVSPTERRRVRSADTGPRAPPG